MADVLPHQSSFLYQTNWNHEIDTMILQILIRLKQESGCEGTVFPSHFIFEVKSVIENELGQSFEWYELVDRIHFLERRYKTFDELVHLEGTYWNPVTNTVIVTTNTWANRLAVWSTFILCLYITYSKELTSLVVSM